MIKRTKQQLFVAGLIVVFWSIVGYLYYSELGWFEYIRICMMVGLVLIALTGLMISLKEPVTELAMKVYRRVVQ